MSNRSQVTFNVVFVRRTVGLFPAFVRSLRDLAPSVEFRLVSNGCTDQETKVLLEWCAQDERLSFLDLGYDQVRPHGVVLNDLHRLEHSSHFAFMDSDCFITADFAPSLFAELRSAEAVFSGQPLWSHQLPHRLGKDFKLLTCPYTELHDGQCAGTSYFAIYDNPFVTAFRAQTGIGFTDYRWHQIPEPIQSELEEAGRRLEWYDTGKLLNVLMGLRGYRCKYVSLPSLWHLGGISSLSGGLLRRRVAKALDAVGLRGALRRVSTQPIGAAERALQESARRRKECVSEYLLHLLRSLEGTPLTVAPFAHDDERLRFAVASAEAHIRALHKDAFAGKSSVATGGISDVSIRLGKAIPTAELQPSKLP